MYLIPHTRTRPQFRELVSGWRVFTRRTVFCLSVLVGGMLSQAAAVAQPGALKPRLDWLCEQLEEKRQELHIPGIAIAIVKDDKVVLSRGFGLRDLDRKLSVDEDTMFAIGSSSKAFTATLVGMLVDDGKMSWDDKVSRHIPYFKLKDETANKKATVRDLLCHRTGMARMGILWAGNKVDRESVIRHAAEAELLYGFREKFNYTNIGYLTAGVASAKAAGEKSWDSLLERRILQPLGMSNTYTDTARFVRDPKASEGYYWDEDIEDHVNPPVRALHACGPAGAINSNVIDMARWLRFQLGGGEFDGKRLISTVSLAETRTKQMAMASTLSYGLGWMLRDWEGHRSVFHGGSIDGFGAMVALLPDDNIGFVLLTNVTTTPLQDQARELVWQAMLGDTVLGSEVAQKSKPGKRIPVAELKPYLGRYRLDRLGVDVTVTLKGGKLAVDIPGNSIFTLSWPNEHNRWASDATARNEIGFGQPVDGVVPSMTLYTKNKQKLSRVGKSKIKADVAKHPRPGEKWSVGQLEPLVGTYRRTKKKGDFRISIHQGRLRLEPPGSRQIMLDWPEENGRWGAVGRPGNSFQFEFDRYGRVNSAVLHGARVLKMPRIQSASDMDTTVADLLKLRKHDRKAWPSDLKMRITGTVNFVNQGVRATVTEIVDGPNRYMIRLDFPPFGYVKTVVDGDSGWIDSDVDVTRFVAGKELDLMKLSHPWRTFGDWHTSFESVEISKKDKLDGENVYVVRCTPKVAPTMVRYVSAKTGLVLKDDTVIVGSGKPAYSATLRYSNYREIAGIQMPARTTWEMALGGRRIFECNKVETDFEIPADTFKKPDDLK